MIGSKLCVMSALALLAACGGESRKRAPDDGASGRAAGGSSGGAGIRNTGGGGTTAEHPAAVGLEAVLMSPFASDNPEARTCKVQPNGARSYAIGQADGDGTVENGTDAVELSCVVTGSGQVSMELHADNQAVGLPGAFAMDLAGVINSTTDGTLNTGTLEFFDASTGVMITSATAPCRFTPAGGLVEIIQQPGALWTNFRCPLLVSPDNPGDGCRAEGTIALEYCKTAAADE